jgi:hypothetical protein
MQFRAANLSGKSQVETFYVSKPSVVTRYSTLHVLYNKMGA